MKNQSSSEVRSVSGVPELTVVVVILQGKSYLIRCLRALTRQIDVPAFEILVPHDESLGDIAMLRAEFPGVQFLSLEGYHTYAELRALGFRQARGRIIALTEDHCIPDPDWCARILETHQGPYAAVGGAVDKEKPDTVLNWAIYLCDFSRYTNPVLEGPSTYLTDCNVAYKRKDLEAIASVWRDEFHETSVNWTLQARGKVLWLSPKIIVRQQRSLTFRRAIRERYAFGRLFASTRVASTTPFRRLLYAVGAIPLPFLLTGRVMSHVFRKRRYIDEFFRALPLIGLMTTIWSWGELIGYLTGRPADLRTPLKRRAEGFIEELTNSEGLVTDLRNFEKPRKSRKRLQ
jgi:hypothetical protein